jgi:ribosomal subunit interface protein
MKLEAVESPITIGSGDVDLGDALRTHAEESILKVASKYFGRLTQASAHFRSEGSGYSSSVTFQMGGLPTVAAEATAIEARLAFDMALEKAAKQLRRKKRELRDNKTP